jgi:hypothetical protein
MILAKVGLPGPFPTPVNWNGQGEKWTFPVGAQFFRLIKIGGKLPVDLVNVLQRRPARIWSDLATADTDCFRLLIGGSCGKCLTLALHTWPDDCPITTNANSEDMR